MRVLVVPMMTMAESAGPASRARALASAMASIGWETTLCVPEGFTGMVPTGVSAQPILTPSPLGMPRIIGRKMFPLAQRLGLNRRVRITCFDDVLRLTGNTDKRYFARAVEQLRKIIQNGRFDAVYSEFNIASIIAAKAEGVPIFGSTSFPTQPSFASDSSSAVGLNRVLRSLSMDPVRSPEDIPLMPNVCFVPSCPELEPFPAESPVIFTGSFIDLPASIRDAPRDAVVAYFGNGAVTPRRGFAVLAEALRGSGLDLYVAGLPESHAAHLHTAPRFDFSELLHHAAIFANHGGQNSMIDGIAYGSPQLICPGKVFERRFNAKAAERCGIGLSLEQSCFDVPTVRRTLEQLLEDAAGYHASAASLKNRLSELGGANRIVDTIARQAYGCPPNSTPPRAPRLYRLPDRKLRVSRCLSS